MPWPQDDPPAAGSAQGFMQTPPSSSSTAETLEHRDYYETTPLAWASAAVVSEKPGSVIGRYKLLQQIGEGGFGLAQGCTQDH
jgi:hypothetical protein